MKTIPVAAIAGLLLGSPLARAGATFYEDARVKNVSPEYERVAVPHEECRSEYVPNGYHRRESGSLLGPVIGGVAGGLLGAQVGRGNGRTAAAAAGAAIGAITGDRLSRLDEGYDGGTREVRSCRTVDQWERRVAGYRVAYEFHGRTYTAMLPYDPGPRLRVRVDIDPVESSRGGFGRDDSDE